MRVRLTRAVQLVVCLVLAAGCKGGDKGITQPNTGKPCGTSGTTQLSPLQAVTVACSAGTTVTLTGGGASYLVVPNLATGTAANQPNAYSIGIVGGASSNLVPVGGASLDLVPPNTDAGTPPAVRRRARQLAFDAALMNDARRQVASGAWKPITRRLAPAAAAARAVVPPEGSIAQFHVLSSESPVRFSRVGARLSFVGANILLYIDTLAPPNGFTASQLQAFGQLFDQTLYPIDVNTFGAPTDIDQNGHLIVLLSPLVNGLTPASQCDTQGFIGGFFDGIDLASNDTSSNQGEIFYSLVPDPNGTVSCAHTVADLDAETPSTFLHELQHLINFGHHVVLHGGASERGWLDEGLSIVAEELGSIYYEDKFPPPTGRTNPSQLFPDSSQGFINGLLFQSYSYLLKTDTATVLLHSDADGGLAWRGGDWLLMRWLGDVKGTAIYKTLVDNGLTGTANIASAAGEAFDGLFGDFSLALYVDSLPGIPKSSIPVRNKFVRRNLRLIYNRLNTVDPADFPRVYPVVPVTLTSSMTSTIVPGTMAFYQVNTTSGQSTITIDFGASPGVALSDALHPQLSIFRLK
jgi:hypothetical protein